MPEYDFKCKKCKKAFTATARISELGKVKCPRCKRKSLERVYESFTFTAITKKKS